MAVDPAGDDPRLVPWGAGLPDSYALADARLKKIRELEAERDRYREALEGVAPYLSWTLAEDAPEGGWEFCPWSPVDLNPRLRAALDVLRRAKNQEDRP